MKLRRIKSVVLRESIRVPGYPGMVEFHDEEARTEQSFDMYVDLDGQTVFLREKRLDAGTFCVPFGNVRYFLLFHNSPQAIAKDVVKPEDFQLEEPTTGFDPYDVAAAEPGTPIVKKAIFTKKA